MRTHRYRLLYWDKNEIKHLETDSFIKLTIFKLLTDWSSYEVNSRKRVKQARKYM